MAERLKGATPETEGRTKEILTDRRRIRYGLIAAGAVAVVGALATWGEKGETVEEGPSLVLKVPSVEAVPAIPGAKGAVIRAMMANEVKNPSVRQSAPRSPAKTVVEELEGERRQAAVAVMELDAAELERLLPKSPSGHLRVLEDMVPELKSLQEALQGNDHEKVKSAANEFLRRASLLETDEAFGEYLKMKAEPGFSQEFKAILIPAFESAQILASLEF